MIICSCTVITEAHIETALVEILNAPDAPLPTPGLVFRHLAKKMNCCGCAPLVVTRIYEMVQKLEAEGRICPYAGASAKGRLERLGLLSKLLRQGEFCSNSRCEARPAQELTSA
jgi:hypothetical protein